MRAVRISDADPAVGRLVRAAAPTGITGFAWFRGVGLVVRLRRPVDLHDAVLPYAAVPPDAPARGTCRRPYAPGWLRVDARRVTRLQLLVDLHTRRVAEVDFDGADRRASAVAGRPHPRCEESG